MDNISLGGNVIFAPGVDSSSFTLLSLGLSTIGIALSSTAVALLLLTAILFEQWRQNYKNQMLLQFIIARFLYVLARYVFDATLVFGLKTNRHGFFLYYDMCLLMYTELALVFWMFMFTKQMYDSLVTVFNVRGNHDVLKTSLLAWLSPAVAVSGMSLACYIKVTMYVEVFLVYFFLFKLPTVFANAVLLILVLRSAIKSNNSRNKSNFRIVIVMLVMIFSFCVQQLIHDIYEVIFLLMSRGSETGTRYTAFFIVFNIFALYQCPASTLFWLFGNAGTRELWKFKKSNGKEYLMRQNSQLPFMTQISSAGVTQSTNKCLPTRQQSLKNHVTFTGQVSSQNIPHRYSSHI